MKYNVVEIVEVGVRDGLQNDPAMMDTASKLAFIDRLLDAGVKRMEVASFVNPKLVPQMADSTEVMAAVPRDRGAQYIGLALNERGVAQAIDAKCDEVNSVVNTSDAFGERNQNKSVNETLVLFERMAAMAREAGVPCSATITTSFGCPFEGEIKIDRLVEVARRTAEAGAAEIALADTIGVANPWDVRDRVNAVRAEIGDIPLRLHVHNTRNTGIANVYAAIEAGVRIVDSSCGGIGGCPFAPKATGNIATEDVAYMLARAGFETGLDLDKLIATANWLETALSHPVPGLVSKAGGFPKVA